MLGDQDVVKVEKLIQWAAIILHQVSWGLIMLQP